MNTGAPIRFDQSAAGPQLRHCDRAPWSLPQIVRRAACCMGRQLAGAALWRLTGLCGRPESSPLAPLLGLPRVRGVSALGVSPLYRCRAARRQLSIGAPESTTTAVYESQTHGSPSLCAPLGSRFFRAVNRSLRSARLGPCDRLALRSSRLALIGASESGCRASNPCCCLIR